MRTAPALNRIPSYEHLKRLHSGFIFDSATDVASCSILRILHANDRLSAYASVFSEMDENGPRWEING